MYRGSGRVKHETSVATRDPGLTEDYRGRGGKLSGNHGIPAHREGATCVSRSLDARQSIHR